jgi:hypothetical protein
MRSKPSLPTPFRWARGVDDITRLRDMGVLGGDDCVEMTRRPATLGRACSPTCLGITTTSSSPRKDWRDRGAEHVGNGADTPSACAWRLEAIANRDAGRHVTYDAMQLIAAVLYEAEDGQSSQRPVIQTDNDVLDIAMEERRSQRGPHERRFEDLSGIGRAALEKSVQPFRGGAA